MAIKVKHEGNATSRLMAASEGGRAKRAVEDGKTWMQIASAEAQAGNKQLTGAHASPISPGNAHATPGHAATGSAPGIIHAPSGAGGGGSHGGSRGGGTGVQPSDGEWKVTGTSIFDRPDAESVWNPNTDQWMRHYLPGEKEAEAQQRVGDVQNAQYEYKLNAQQRAEIDGINQAIEEARQSGSFTPDELAALERQAYAKMAGINPLPTPKSEPVMPNVQMIEGRPYVLNGNKWDPVETSAGSASDIYGNTHVDEQGRRWGVDKGGKLYEIGSPKDDFGDFMKLVPKTRTETQTRIDPHTGKTITEDVEVPLTPEEQLEYIQQLRDMRDKFNMPRQSPNLDPNTRTMLEQTAKDALDPTGLYGRISDAMNAPAPATPTETPVPTPPKQAAPLTPPKPGASASETNAYRKAFHEKWGRFVNTNKTITAKQPKKETK